MDAVPRSNQPVKFKCFEMNDQKQLNVCTKKFTKMVLHGNHFTGGRGWARCATRSNFGYRGEHRASIADEDKTERKYKALLVGLGMKPYGLV